MDNQTKDITENRAFGNFLQLRAQQSSIIEYAGTHTHYRVAAEASAFKRLAISEDGNTLAGATHGVLCVWDVKCHRRIGRYVFDCDITHIELTSTGQSVVVAEAAGNVFLIDVAFREITPIGDSSTRLSAIAIDASGSRVAICDVEGLLRVFDATTQQEVQSLRWGRTANRLWLSWADDVLTASSARTVQAFRLSSGKLLASYGEISIAPDDDRLPEFPVITSRDGILTVFDRRTAAIVCEIGLVGERFDYTRNGSIIAVGCCAQVRVYDGSDGHEIRRIRSYVHNVSDLRLSGNGNDMYLCGDAATIEHLSLQRGRSGTFADLYAPIMAALPSDSDEKIIVADSRGIVGIHDVGTGEVQRYTQHTACISKLATLGSLIVTGAHDGLARVLDIETGADLATVSLGGPAVMGVALDPKGFFVAGNAMGRMARFEISTGELVVEYSGNDHAIRAISISACRQYVMSTADHGDVLIFDYETGQLINRIGWPGMIYAGCFDDAGEFIYFGSCCGKLVKASPLARGHVKEWDLFRNELRSITIRDGKLSCIGIEGDAAIVDLATGEVLLKCPVKTMPYRRVAFTNHDGTRLVTGGADGKLTIRSATDGKPLAEMHNLGGGYLWTLCVDQEKRPGQQWFWTDRDDLIEVHRNDAGIECVIPWSHPEHADFIELHNDRIATLSMAGLCRDLPPDGFDKGPAAPDIAGLLA